MRKNVAGALISSWLPDHICREFCFRDVNYRVPGDEGEGLARFVLLISVTHKWIGLGRGSFAYAHLFNIQGGCTMKKLLMMSIAAMMLLSLGFAAPADLSAESAIRVPLSMSYNSTYWWRGVEINGKSVGVLWLGAGIQVGNTGLILNAYAALPEDYLIQTDKTAGPHEDHYMTQKSITEFDYGATYETDIAGIATLGLGAYYVHYAFFDEANPSAIDPSFIETSLSLALKTFLTPKITFYYDYFMEERTGRDGKPTPVNEDYYINFALSQALIEAQGFTFSVGGWVGYYNNAYLEASGWSDAGVTLGFTYSHGDASFGGNFNYARSLTEDFQVEYSDVGVLKNHLWVEFDVSYKI